MKHSGVDEPVSVPHYPGELLTIVDGAVSALFVGASVAGRCEHDLGYRVPVPGTRDAGYNPRTAFSNPPRTFRYAAPPAYPQLPCCSHGRGSTCRNTVGEPDHDRRRLGAAPHFEARPGPGLRLAPALEPRGGADPGVPVAATIRPMDAAGVAKSLISAWVALRNIMISNDEVAGFVNEYPDRLVGVGSVDISRPMQAVAEIRRFVEELGFRGIRVLPWLWERPPTDRLFYPVYAACCELGAPFCTQIGHTGR